MGEDDREQICLVGYEALERDVFHVGVCFQFGEDVFLGTASIMEREHLCHGSVFVGDDHLVSVAEYLGDEKIELNRLLVDHSLPGAYKEEAEGTVPGHWFPRLFEADGVPAACGPPLSGFDHVLEFDEAFERHGDGKLDGAVRKHGYDVFAEESGVHADFDDDTWQGGADFVYACCDERQCVMGVVDVAGAVVQVEHLSGLRDGTEQWIIAAPSFMFLVEPDGGLFGMAFGGNDGSVEVECDPKQVAGA